MKHRTVVLLLLAAGSAGASVIALESNGTTPTSCSSSPVCEWNNQSFANFVIPTANLPGAGAWAPNPTDNTAWVSYENTGWDYATGSAVIQNANDMPTASCPGYNGGSMTIPASTWTPGQIASCNAGSPTGQGTPDAIFFEQFTDSDTNIQLNLTIWADDTVAVYLNGVEIVPSVFIASPVGHCDETAYGFGLGPSECANGEIVNLSVPSGTNTLEFDVYQVGGATYGVMWDGSLTGTSPTPEPSTLALLGGGLVGLALLRKRIF